MGVVIYELLTGEKPFRGTLETIAYKICHEEPPSPSTLSKLKLAGRRRPLVATALAKAPEARFQSAREFRKALDDVAKMSVEVDDGVGTTVVNIGTLMLAKPAPAWDDDTLRTAEHELARALGPMAKVIVRRAAAQTVDRSELCAILSDSITDPESRRRFVTAFNKAGGGQSSTGASGVRTGSAATRATSPGTRTGAMATPVEAGYVEQVIEPACGLHRTDRAGADEESGARIPEPCRVRAPLCRESRDAGTRRVPARAGLRVTSDYFDWPQAFENSSLVRRPSWFSSA